MKKAMVDVSKNLQNHHRQSPWLKLQSQVHDELVASVQTEYLHEGVQLISGAMRGAQSLSVPLVVKVTVGPSLGELELYRPPSG
jgi:DNA polymerase I-like protein with 3'-5' exonuclease and polymerase domains